MKAEDIPARHNQVVAEAHSDEPARLGDVPSDINVLARWHCPAVWVVMGDQQRFRVTDNRAAQDGGNIERGTADVAVVTKASDLLA